MTFIDTLPAAQVVSSIDAMRASDHGRFYIDHVANGDCRFALFMLLVDRKMKSVLGVTHRDIADALWRDYYQDGMEPGDAIIEALQGDDLYARLIPVLQQMP